MGSWSIKRKILYGGSFILALAIILGGISYELFYRAPTCSDGKQDGNETGVDCGGSCTMQCTSDSLTPVVLWSKIFNVSGDLYTAVAYIENPNISSSNPSATYQFKIYDANNNLITVKQGQTSIPKNSDFAVFQVGIVLSNSKPKSADFAFTSLSSWQKDTTSPPDVSLNYSTLISTTTSPQLTGTVSNNSFSGNISSLELDAFILDSNQNVIGASQTFINNLAAQTSQSFVFTWPQPFVGTPSVVNVIYR